MLIGESQQSLDLLNTIPAGSLVTASGTLCEQVWQVGDGSQRRALQMIVDQLVLLYDARRGRMLL